MTDALTWLKNARKQMTKRVWVPDMDRDSNKEFWSEVEGGAIPNWWIDQEISRLELEKNREALSGL